MKKNRPESIEGYTKIIVEKIEDENKKISVAEITNDYVKAANGYIVRMTPKYN